MVSKTGRSKKIGKQELNEYDLGMEQGEQEEKIDQKLLVEPYVAQKKWLSAEYEPVLFEHTEIYQSIYSESKLFDALMQDFLTVRGQKIVIGLDDDQALYRMNQLSEIETCILTLAADKKNAKVLRQMNQVLYRCMRALDDPDDFDNLTQLAVLAKELPGYLPAKYKIPSIALASLLITFCLVTITVGLLATPVTGGGGLLISAAAVLQLQATALALTQASCTIGGLTVSAGAGITTAGTAGLIATSSVTHNARKSGFFSDSGLSKAVSTYATDVINEQTDADVHDSAERGYN